MDCLECKICNVPYDEEEHRPRHAPCGHEFCSACIKALIKDTIYVCPTCRKKNRVNVPEDLPVSFGLIDVIRAFKNKKMSLPSEIGSRSSTATNKESCKIHHRFIQHWCLKCIIWICHECLEHHSTDTGCSIISSATAMEDMKKEHTKITDKILTAFDVDTTALSSEIQEHADKRKILLEKAEEHSNEIKNIQIMLEQGKIQKENLVQSRRNLNIANSPYALMDQIEVLTQRKQSLHSWAVRNIGADTNIQKALIKEKEIAAVDMVIKGGARYDKVLHDTKIGTLDNRRSQVEALSSNSPDVICVEPESHYFFYEIKTLLIHNVKRYIQENDKDKNFRLEDDILSPLLQSQKQRIRCFAETKNKEPFNTPGIFDFGVYLLSNGVPMEPLINIYACEVVWQVCQKANQTTPLVDKLSKEVSLHFESQRELWTRTDVKETYNDWLKSYKTFLECAWILVYFIQQFEKNNLYCALPLILKACSVHKSLTESLPQGPRKTLDGNVLWKFRRTCLLTLNEKLYNSFNTGDGLETVSELTCLIVPAMAQMSTSPSKEDEDAIARVRNKWCNLLERELGSPAKTQIGEQILKIILIDLNNVTCRNLPTEVPRHHTVLALYKQYTDMCRMVYGPPRQTSDM